MLRQFRRKLTSWLMLGFLAIAVGAMVITGFGTGGVGGLPAPGQSGGDVLAEVGDEEIAADELERLIRRQLEEARQNNPELDIGRFIQAGAFDGILNQMVVGRALWAFGRAHGLTVSDRMIDRVIANIPEFRNFAGQFDDATYRQALSQQNMTEEQLRQEIANFLMQRQLQMPIGLGARVPDSVAAQYASLMLERRRGSIGVVPIEAVAQGIAPTPQEVAAFYARNRSRYTIPERRVIRYSLLGREQVAAQAQPTEAEIAAYYRENQERYAGAETRTLQQVVLPEESAARAFVQRAGGGADFAAAARHAGFGASDIDLGQQSREQLAELTNAAVANAVFGAAQGAVVGPLRSELGWHVVRVERINRASGRPLEAVRAEISTALERRKFEDALGGLVSRIEERIADGASFEEIVQAERLQVVATPAITAAGTAPGEQWQAPAELRPLLRGAFQIDAENPEPAVETVAQGQSYALVSLARVVPATVPPLQQIADHVRTDVIRQRAGERARALAQRIVAAINGGTAPARAFAAAGVRLAAPQPVNARRLDISQGGRQVPPPLVMLFSIPEGRARMLEAPNGSGWFVVHVAERTPGQASCPHGQQPAAAQASEGCRLIQAVRGEFAGQAGTEYTEQFARSAQQGIEIRRNEEAIASTRQRLVAGSAQ